MNPSESIQITRPRARKPRLNLFLFLATMIASLGTFQCGYSVWVVHSSAATILDFPNSTFANIAQEKDPLKFRKRLLAYTTMMFPLGAVFGVLLLGFFVDHWGRKGCLFFNNCVNIAAATLMGFSRSWSSYNMELLARFVNGLASGTFSCVVPLYVVEISPAHLRGSLYMVSFLFLTLGVLVAQMIGLYRIFGNPIDFPFLMSLVGVMAIFNMVLLQFIPESPRYLFIQKGDEEEAEQALKVLRKKENVQEEMEEMRQEGLSEAAEKNMNVIKLIYCPELRWQVISTVILMAGNQLSGVHGLYYYGERIYISLGLNTRYIHIMLIGVSTGLHLVTLLAVFSIDSIGRRFLLLVGYMICSMMSVLLAVCLELQIKNNPSMAYLSSMAVILFFAAHMLGPGPISALLVGELFLQSARGSASVIGWFVNWSTRFVLGALFTKIEPLIGPYSLLFFWPLSILTFVYIFKMIPETKGRTFREIQKAMETRLQKKAHHRKKRAKSRAGMESFH